MPPSLFSQSRIAAMKKWSQGGGGPGRYCPGTPSDQPHSTMPSQAWGTYVVCGSCQAGTTARANAISQIVSNSSSLYTLFYPVIYNSVLGTFALSIKIICSPRKSRETIHLKCSLFTLYMED